jgi:thiosulfate/3-mercaptopyruvate sulfurtransferase
MSNYAHPESLVDTQWVADHLNDPSVRFIEVDWDIAEYNSGHIPGAVGWVWRQHALQELRRDIPDEAEFEARLSNCGIANDTTVVVYGGLSNLLATFTFWLFKVYGHKDVRLLDGGRQKWMNEERPTSTEAANIRPCRYAAQKPDWTLRAHCDLVHDAIGQPTSVLVDARPADMYDGQNAANAQRGGHIPSAVNIPAKADVKDGAFAGWLVPTVRDDGTFKSFKELQTMFSGKGVTPDKEIIVYCVLGGLSSHLWFTLTQLLGHPKVRLYDGSWAEWGNLISAPIEMS